MTSCLQRLSFEFLGLLYPTAENGRSVLLIEFHQFVEEVEILLAFDLVLQKSGHYPFLLLLTIFE